MPKNVSQDESPLARILITAAIAWALWTYMPDRHADQVHLALWWFGALVVAIGLLKSISGLIGIVTYVFKLLRIFGRDETRGSAGWMTAKELRRLKLHKRRKGSRLIGIVAGAALWLATETHHLILGPSGSQKSTAAIANILMGCSESALIIDIKGELWEMTRAHRQRAFRHRCVKFDPKDLANSVKINPLDPIAREVETDDSAALTRVRGMALQLCPDPEGGGGQNDVFYKGARNLIVTTILSVIVVLPPEHRNLAMVYRTLSDLDILHDLLDAASKSKNLRGEIADMARSLHAAAFGDGASSKTFESFRTNALLALEAFGPGNYLAEVTSETTFEFSELKERPTSLYILIDYANSEVLGKISGLLQWMAADAMVMAGNNTPALFVLDECCNAPLYSLPKILTLLRSAGVKCILATQDLDDFTRVYSKHALETVLSETDIKQFLGGIRSKSTLEYLSSYLGEYSEISSSFSLGDGGLNENISRTNRRLQTDDQLRRLPTGAQIVIYANLRPILARKVQVFAVAPWRKLVGANKAYGNKRNLLPIELSIGRWRTRVTAHGRRAYREILSEVTGHANRPSRWLVPSLLAAFVPGTAVMAALAIAVTVLTVGLPNLRWEYGYRGSARQTPLSFVWCRYVGPNAPGVIRGPHCPLILWRKVW